MLSFLNGIPGKLKVLNDRLSSTWAGYLTTIHTGLTTGTRMANLDKLNITGNVASAADVSALSALNSPVLKPPIAGGITANTAVNVGLLSTAHSLFDIQSTNSTTSYIDVVNYTGSGVVEFCAFQSYGGAAGQTSDLDIIIDGITVYSGTSATTGSADVNTRVPIGSIDTYSIYTYASPGAVPFKTSLQIRHKRTGTTTASIVVCKYRKTS